MRTEDLIPFTAALATKMVTYWDTDLDELAIMDWFEAINLGCPNSTVEQFSAALLKWVAGPKGEFKPRPASIIALMPGSAASHANKAWQAAEMTVRTAGRNRSVIFEDAAIGATIEELGGWFAFCSSLDKPENMEFLRKEFTQIYHAKSLEKNAPEVLAGGHQIANGDRMVLRPASLAKIECSYLRKTQTNILELAGN